MINLGNYLFAEEIERRECHVFMDSREHATDAEIQRRLGHAMGDLAGKGNWVRRSAWRESGPMLRSRWKLY